VTYGLPPGSLQSALFLGSFLFGSLLLFDPDALKLLCRPFLFGGLFTAMNSPDALLRLVRASSSAAIAFYCVLARVVTVRFVDCQ
jgi:hypothetical protein